MVKTEKIQYLADLWYISMKPLGGFNSLTPMSQKHAYNEAYYA